METQDVKMFKKNGDSVCTESPVCCFELLYISDSGVYSSSITSIPNTDSSEGEPPKD